MPFERVWFEAEIKLTYRTFVYAAVICLCEQIILRLVLV